MPKNWKQLALIIVVSGVSLVAALVFGLWGYVVATNVPLHENPASVPAARQFTPSARWADAAAKAEQLLRAEITSQNLPAVSVAVGADGELAWSEALGWANLEKKETARPATRFRALGVSMALTSAGVGRLLEQDRLSLDDEIQKHVPQYPQQQWPVTLRELMGHVAGVENDPGDEAPLMDRCETTLDGLKLSHFAEHKLLFEPETRYRYSTYGWILVSAAVEAAARQPFFAFMRERIFAPLGMEDTEPDAMDAIPERATFYYPRFAEENRYGPELAREGDYSCWAGAGAYLSTPADLVRFGLGLNAGTLLEPDTVKKLQSTERLSAGQDSSVGLGWRIETTPIDGVPTRMVSQTDRRSVGGSASLVTFPDRRLVVAVMTNTSFVDVQALAVSVAKIFVAK